MIQEEYIKRKTATKVTYYYKDEELKIDQISREVFLKIDKIVHFPRGFNGGDKYHNLKKIIFINFKKVLPVGVHKSLNYGWGFTKDLKPFAIFIDDVLSIKEVIMEKDGNIEIDKSTHKLYINQDFITDLRTKLLAIYNKNKSEIDNILKNTLSEYFPKEIKKPEKKYLSDSLSTALSQWGNDISEFSDDDKEAIQELFTKLTLKTDFLSIKRISSTKQNIDTKFLEVATKEFKKLIKASTESESLEAKWHAFLHSNNWIFSYILAQPVLLFKNEGYVGGKTIDNKNGKFTDFLLKNKITENICFIEIKTHNTPIIESKSYRGNEVFSVTKELSGCINQVLNQRDNLQKNYYQKIYTSRDSFEITNSECIIIIGMVSKLSKEQRYSFELFRTNFKDVKIVGFDELLEKIDFFYKLFIK